MNDERRRIADPAISELSAQMSHLNSGVREALGEIKTLRKDVGDLRVEQAARSGTLATHKAILDAHGTRITETEKDIKQARRGVLGWAVGVLTTIITLTIGTVWVVKK